MIRQIQTAYGPFSIYDNDHIGQYFLSGQYYEDGMIASIIKYCGPRRRMAIDVGANYGAHSVVYAHKFESVVAFEPQNHLFELLEKNLEVPGTVAKCTAYNMALGHQSGQVSINQKKTSKQANYGGRDISLKRGGTQMRTLDSFGFDGVDLIKIDVEGAEGLVLSGARETIRKWEPIIFFEFNKFKEFNQANNVPEEFNLDILEFLFSDCQYRQILRLGQKNLLCIPRKQV